MSRRFNRERRRREEQNAPLCKVCGGFMQRERFAKPGTPWTCVSACWNPSEQPHDR